MICNWKIARRELDVSGSQHNPNIREKRLVRFLLSILLGKPTLVKHFVDQCPDFVTGRSLEELGQRMKEVTGDGALDSALMKREVIRYDATIGRGKPLFNDDQLRRIAQLRNWRGDRLRMCDFQRIVDDGAMPLIAIRMTVMARKSLGGIQTDLQSRVLRGDGNPVQGLFAVVFFGEFAGVMVGFGVGEQAGAAQFAGYFGT